jgi:hypothetical protein
MAGLIHSVNAGRENKNATRRWRFVCIVSDAAFLVARGGIEPPTQGFSILCSTN